MVAFRLSWSKDLCSVPQCCMFLAWLLPPCREPHDWIEGRSRRSQASSLAPTRAIPISPGWNEFLQYGSQVFPCHLGRYNYEPTPDTLMLTTWLWMFIPCIYVVCRSFPGGLTVIVKAGCLFEVVSSMSGKFGDPYSTTCLDLLFLKEVLHQTMPRRPLAQSSRHSGQVRSLSLWHGANFDSQGDLVHRRIDLGKEGFYRDLAQRSRHETTDMELVQRSCQYTSYRDLVRRPLIEILYRDLARRPYRDLAQRPWLEFFLPRSCQ